MRKTEFRKDQIPIFFVNILVLAVFSYIFSVRRDFEFLAYVGIILIAIAFIHHTNRRAGYSNALSWVLSIWAWMHMAGSAFYIGGVKLYDRILIPLAPQYGIIRYDQVVHAIGMMAATIALYYLISTFLKPEYSSNWNVLILLLVAVGLGMGTANEVVEFIVTIFIKENGVGDYLNTSLDHLANLLGVFLGLVYIRTRAFGEKK